MTDPLPDYPAWFARLYPDGIPDELAYETPMSDAQASYLRALGVHDRWCSAGEASVLIRRILRERKRAARERKLHVEGTP